MTDKTTRQRIEEILRDRPSISPSGMRDALSDYKISLTPDKIVDEIQELNQSIDDTIEVQPATCKSCGFNKFDNIANIPSNCPECKSEWIKEPRFRIDK